MHARIFSLYGCFLKPKTLKSVRFPARFLSFLRPLCCQSQLFIDSIIIFVSSFDLLQYILFWPLYQCPSTFLPPLLLLIVYSEKSKLSVLFFRKLNELDASYSVLFVNAVYSESYVCIQDHSAWTDTWFSHVVSGFTFTIRLAVFVCFGCCRGTCCHWRLNLFIALLLRLCLPKSFFCCFFESDSRGRSLRSNFFQSD